MKEDVGVEKEMQGQLVRTHLFLQPLHFLLPHNQQARRAKDKQL